MSGYKISYSLALLLLSCPLSTAAAESSDPNTSQSISTTIGNSPYKTSLRRMKERLAQAAKIEPMGTYVGELQERWQFPSDHLPIGMTFDDVNIASWNVLDADYMSWVTEKDSQGLKRSMIVDEHVYIEGTNITVRDRHIVDLILSMISSPTHPRSILNLQECNKPFLNELSVRLPENYATVSSYGEAIVFDTNLYELVSARNIKGLFSMTPERGIQEVILQNKLTGEKLKLVNVHLPGDPLHPARYEFASYLSSTLDPSTPTIATGDMNFNELEMQEALDLALSNQNDIALYSAYCTNISPFEFNSKAIDHFIVYAPERQLTINAPEEVMEGLSKMVDLLQPGL